MTTFFLTAFDADGGVPSSATETAKGSCFDDVVEECLSWWGYERHTNTMNVARIISEMGWMRDAIFFASL